MSAKPMSEWTDEEIRGWLARLDGFQAGNGGEARALREVLRLRAEAATAVKLVGLAVDCANHHHLCRSCAEGPCSECGLCNADDWQRQACEFVDSRSKP